MQNEKFREDQAMMTLADFGLRPETVSRFVVQVAMPDGERALKEQNHPRRPPRAKPQAKEVRLKEWVMAEAERLGIAANSVHMRIQRGKYPDLKLRRVNKQNIFVKVSQ